MPLLIEDGNIAIKQDITKQNKCHLFDGKKDVGLLKLDLLYSNKIFYLEYR